MRLTVVIPPALAASVGGDASGSLKSLIDAKAGWRGRQAGRRYKRPSTVYGRSADGGVTPLRETD
jgi:hypothetical protein